MNVFFCFIKSPSKQNFYLLYLINQQLQTTAESVFTKKVSDIISESGCPAKQKCILTLTATDSSGVQKSSSWFALTYPKDSVLPSANVKVFKAL